MSAAMKRRCKAYENLDIVARCFATSRMVKMAKNAVKLVKDMNETEINIYMQ